MNANILLSGLLLGGLALVPFDSAAPAAGQGDVLPPAIRTLVVPGNVEEQPTLLELLRELGKCTGQEVLMDSDAEELLSTQHLPLLAGAEVPAAEVYPFVEGILAHHSVYIAPVKGGSVPMLGVYPTALLQRGGSQNQRASIAWTVVPADEVSVFEDHPALFIQTVIHLPSLDVRQVSTSMRVLFSDPFTGSVVPIGEHSLLVRGSGRTVAQTVEFLRLCEESEKVHAEARKARSGQGQPGGRPPQGG